MSRRFAVTFVVIWIVLLVGGSLLPERAKVTLHTQSGAHRFLHFAAFGSTALLLVSISRSPSQRFAALFAVIGMGISVELLQHLIYHCRFEGLDVRDDIIASIAGYLLALSKTVSRAVAGSVGFA